MLKLSPVELGSFAQACYVASRKRLRPSEAVMRPKAANDNQPRRTRGRIGVLRRASARLARLVSLLFGLRERGPSHHSIRAPHPGRLLSLTKAKAHRRTQARYPRMRLGECCVMTKTPSDEGAPECPSGQPRDQARRQQPRDGNREPQRSSEQRGHRPRRSQEYSPWARDRSYR